jgi:gluconolactonase
MSLHRRSVLFYCGLAVLFCASAVADEIPGVGTIGPVQQVETGFGFTEGPAADGDGNVYFTDILKDRIHQLKPDGTLTVFVEPAGTCNGLMVNGDRLLACSMKGRLTSFSLADGKETVLAAEHNGARFNAPNDLVIDQSGGIYFTDPRFRSPDPYPQGKEAVYYRSADGKVTRVAENDFAPNGVILSPDEKTLYVIPSFERRMWAYPVTGPGEIGKGTLFCELNQKDANGNGGGDGLTVDTNGNLYITSGLGLQVFNSAGKHLGTIAIPETPANVSFAGKDIKTLYVTARTSLYTVTVEAQGHVFPGPPASPQN